MTILSITSKRFNEFSLLWLGVYCSASFVVAYIFLNNILLALGFSSVGFLMERYTAKDRARKKKNEQLIQFREFVDIVNGSMSVTNKAVEVCVDEAIDCMKKTHMDRSKVFRELSVLQNNLHKNFHTTFPVELMSFAQRLDNMEIIQFASSVAACYGINNQGITRVIRNFSTLIQEKGQIDGEIQAEIASQKWEAMIMLFAPSLVIFMLNKTMTNFGENMYGTGVGRGLMIGGLLINMAMFFLIQKIVRKGA